MVRRYDFATCTIKRYTETEKRGSVVQDTSVVYENIPCSYWKSKVSFWGSSLAVQSDISTLEMNITPEYQVFKGDIVILREEIYKIQEVIPHPDRFWTIDNLQIFIIPSKDE